MRWLGDIEEVTASKQVCQPLCKDKWAEAELQWSDLQRSLTVAGFCLVWLIRGDANMIQRWFYKTFFFFFLVESSVGCFHFSNVSWLAQGCPAFIVVTHWGRLPADYQRAPREEEGWQAFPPEGYPGKFQRRKHVIMNPGKAIWKPCTQPFLETLSLTLTYSSSLGKRLRWHHPVPFSHKETESQRN